MRTVSRPIAVVAGLLLGVGTVPASPAVAQDAPGPLVTSSSQIDPGSAPVLAAASPNGRMLYVVSSTPSGAKATLSWIDPTGPRETRAAAIGARPTGLAVSPDGNIWGATVNRTAGDAANLDDVVFPLFPQGGGFPRSNAEIT